MTAVQNEESPVLARSFCKTDWTKPKYVTKPYSDVRSKEATETPNLPIEDLGALEKCHNLKFVVLRKLLKNTDFFKFEVVKKKYQQILVYVFGWPQIDKSTELSADENKESTKLNATTAKQNEEEKLAQKIEEITEVPLVEAEARADILNPPQILGPSVMTFNRSNTTEAQTIDDLAEKYLKVMSSRKKIDEQFLSAQMEKLGLWSYSVNELKKPEGTVPNIVKYNSLDDEDTIQSKISDDTDRLNTEDNTTAVKKDEHKAKDSQSKGDAMLIDITLFGSSCPRNGQSILKEAYDISRDSILTAKENMTQSNNKIEPTSQPNQLYTIYDELPEIKADNKISLTELLRRVRERNKILHRREMELQMASEPVLDPEAKRPGCQPPSPHIGQQPRVSRSPPLIQRPCPSKPREPIKPEAPAKKDPCAKCTTVPPSPTTAALLLGPLVLPPFLPLLMCSISPMVSYSVSNLSCAKVLTDSIKERLFGFSKSEKTREETMERIDVEK